MPTATCTRSDALASGASYPDITVTVSVDDNAAASVTNEASVSGGGDVDLSNNHDDDLTTIDPQQFPLDVTIGGGHRRRHGRHGRDQLLRPRRYLLRRLRQRHDRAADRGWDWGPAVHALDGSMHRLSIRPAR